MRDRVLMLAAGTLWLACLLGTGVSFFSHHDGPFLLKTIRFVTSLVLALAYLTMGFVVWHWVNRRRVALLLGAFCFAMAVTFAGETAAVAGDRLISAMTGVSSSFAFLLFSMLLFHFPHDIRSWVTTALSWVLAGLCVAGGGGYAVINNIAYPAPEWLNMLGFLYDILTIVTIVATMGVSYFLSSPRDRSLSRIILLGTILSFLPLLLGTILPAALGLPSGDSIDAQYTSLFFALLPAALGYAALRHQLILMGSDRRAQRITFGVATATFLLTALYLCWLFTMLFITGRINQIAFFTISCFLLFNGILFAVGKMTRAIFFPVRSNASAPSSRFLSTMQITAEYARSLMEALGISTALHFLIEPLSQEYQLIAPLQRREMRLWKDLAPSLFNGEEGPVLNSALIAQLKKLKRPVGLEDLPGEDQRTRHMRAQQRRGEILFVPLLTQQSLIGVLILPGPERSSPSFGVPDVEQIMRQYQPMIDTACSIEQQQALAQRLSTFYSNSTKLFTSPGAASTALAPIIAESVGGRVELWLTAPSGSLMRMAAAGTDAPLLCQDTVAVLAAQGGQARFFEHEQISSEDSALPRQPFAWLPLLREDQRLLGALAIIYRPPHSFSPDEREILTVFAKHCAAVLDDAQVVLERERMRHDRSEGFYQDQADADRLREKTLPLLLAADGYTQLLSLYRGQLSAEQEAFVQEKATSLLKKVTDEVARLLQGHSPPG